MTKSPNIQVMLLPPQEVERYVADILPSMQKALDRRDDWNALEVLTRAARGGILVWVATDAGRYIGHLSAYPKERELRVLTMGGERGQEWIRDVNNQLKSLVESGIYDQVVTSARPGMERWLKALGWKKIRAIMEMV